MYLRSVTDVDWVYSCVELVSGAGLRWAFSWRTLRRGTSPNVAIVWVGGQCAAAAAESRRNRSGAHGEGS